jgi:AcrR family transcriptional regulator
VNRAPEPPEGRGLRVDAERNRRRILAAAQDAFSDLGIDVPMAEVARRAGVGVGTLYRRYPTRADLVAAAFEEKMAAYAEAAKVALEDPDPWRGFCDYVRKICAMQADNSGFTTVLTMTFPTAKRFEADRDRAFADFSALVERAKAAGRLRADFVTEDMPLFLMANAGVLTATADAAPESSERVVGYLLQGCATAAATDPLPPPPEPGQLYRAMLGATRPQNEPGG